MKIEQYENEIESDLAWRKVEIAHLFKIMSDAETKEVVMKSMILLLYAHWEGFIKRTSKLYLKYVSEQNVKNKDLTVNFKALMLKKFAQECIDNDGRNLQKEFDFMNKQNKIENKPFKIKVDPNDEFDEDIINTQHNLSSKVLKNITQIVGMEYNDVIKQRSNYIDAMLLNHRNSIGHAGKFANSKNENNGLSFDKVEELKDFIVVMLNYYGDISADYAIKQFYLVENDEDRKRYESEVEEKLNKEIEKILHRRQIKLEG
ncbi:MAE_28990/MAE_18760 family HEPN-like nuclease [Streptococcus equinus]|uniref:MAE_28990/MAE_18760 family HEPN-like nuclease n=1 Tax=Streptococcus equinus TaxID=1335 RepID=UPI003BF8E2CE